MTESFQTPTENSLSQNEILQKWIIAKVERGLLVFGKINISSMVE